MVWIIFLRGHALDFFGNRICNLTTNLLFCVFILALLSLCLHYKDAFIFLFQNKRKKNIASSIKFVIYALLFEFNKDFWNVCFLSGLSFFVLKKANILSLYGVICYFCDLKIMFSSCFAFDFVLFLELWQLEFKCYW